MITYIIYGIIWIYWIFLKIQPWEEMQLLGRLSSALTTAERTTAHLQDVAIGNMRLLLRQLVGCNRFWAGKALGMHQAVRTTGRLEA